MLKIKQTIIVEGKYDKIKLKSVVDANIITTDGFRIYNDSEKRALIKNIAEKTGIIILTDSDSAGRRLRNFIKNCVNSDSVKNITNVYIPKIPGKEKRKAMPSKENILGVEGTDKDLLIDVLKKFGINDCRARRPRRAVKNIKHKKFRLTKVYGAPGSSRPTRQITKTDFYNDGLSGGENSSKKREYLCGRLNIPYMQSNALLEAVNILTDYDEYKKIMTEYNGI